LRGGGKKPYFALRLDVEGFLLDTVSLDLEFVAFTGHSVVDQTRWMVRFNCRLAAP
jgi:hypothetical protein